MVATNKTQNVALQWEMIDWTTPLSQQQHGNK